MAQDSAAPETMGRTHADFLRHLTQDVEDLVEHWHIARKRSCSLQDIKDLRIRTEKLVDQLLDKRVDRLLDRVRHLDDRLKLHNRTQRPLSRMEVETITTLMMALRQASMEEVPAQLRKRARDQAAVASQSQPTPIAPAPTVASPVVFMIAGAGAGISTLAEDLRNFGFDVRVFEDRDVALRALPDQPPSAFIARLHPSQSVADLCNVTQALRDRVPASVPVFWIVDRADPRTRLKILRAGADGCFQEPVPTASLARRLLQRIPAEGRVPHRVLLVHADPEMRKLRKALLHETGLVVESVDDPMQALRVALPFAPEVVLIDASLPAMHGLELAHLLREEDGLQTVPIVLLCEGSDLMENRPRFRQLELDYLLHPFTESDLLERLCLRASQYRNMRSRVWGRMGRPGVLLERYHFEEVLEDVRTSSEPHGFRVVVFLEIEGYGRPSRSHHSSILDLLPARIEAALRPYLGKEDVAAHYDSMAYAALIHRTEAQQLEALEKSLRKVATAVLHEDLRLTDLRMRLGMAQVGPQGDARAALREAATRARATLHEEPAAETGLEAESPAENPAIETPTLDAAGRRLWSSRIRNAVLGNKLRLVFQPMFPVSGQDTIERYEVLLRIREDNGEMRLPSETLAMAEQLGMAVLLDRWVIDTALEKLSAHRKASPNTIFFLKVTADTIQDDRFLGRLEETLHRCALDPRSVAIEVRETDAAAQRPRTLDVVRRLREQGMAVGLEHFGLRATSFELMKALDVDFVKLDRALVLSLADGANSVPSIPTLLHQIRARDVKIIAPFIEDAGSLTKLWSERVDLLQGNFLHEPDPDLG